MNGGDQACFAFGLGDMETEVLRTVNHLRQWSDSTSLVARAQKMVRLTQNGVSEGFTKCW